VFCRLAYSTSPLGLWQLRWHYFTFLGWSLPRIQENIFFVSVFAIWILHKSILQTLFINLFNSAINFNYWDYNIHQGNTSHPDGLLHYRNVVIITTIIIGIPRSVANFRGIPRNLGNLFSFRPFSGVSKFSGNRLALAH
jgi:hypothetical protein